jgi:hypothetical protein
LALHHFNREDAHQLYLQRSAYIKPANSDNNDDVYMEDEPPSFWDGDMDADRSPLPPQHPPLYPTEASQPYKTPSLLPIPHNRATVTVHPIEEALSNEAAMLDRYPLGQALSLIEAEAYVPASERLRSKDADFSTGLGMTVLHDVVLDLIFFVLALQSTEETRPNSDNQLLGLVTQSPAPEELIERPGPQWTAATGIDSDRGLGDTYQIQ